MKYLVTAVPWEHGWELYIPTVGVTQASTLEAAPAMAISYISLLLDVPPERITVEITPMPRDVFEDL